ncbi:MAG: NAD+ synthase [Thermoleophilia bacterium]|nr:NAD+ synthase [Thermoleophilia bacterium]
MNTVRLALAQINSTVGDLAGNVAKIADGIERAAAAGADLVAFPELALCGYPPEDLTFNPDFLTANRRALAQLAPLSKDIAVVVGFVDSEAEIYNAAAILYGGRQVGVSHKIRLPNYGVFDEFRYFTPGSCPTLFDLKGNMVGLGICEDIWYPDEPIGTQVAEGATLILNISASPYRVGRTRNREEMLETRARDYLTPIALVNLVGGQDELVFDGNSLVYDPHGKMLARGRSFEEDLIIADIDFNDVANARHRDGIGRLDGLHERHKGPVSIFSLDGLREKRKSQPAGAVSALAEPHMPEPLSGLEEVHRALVVGLGDYVRKNIFQKVVVGLSGGVDSSLVAAVAVDALGAGNVVGVSMPSRYTSEGTRADAGVLAENLGIEFRIIPIEPIFESYLEVLKPEFAGREPDVTEENLQARIRGNLLMALSNKYGWLVLTTGNKSESSVGYATLYGDMAGGFAMIKDVPKTMVYDLCRYLNSRGEEIIPESVITREPSAELAPEQKDSDTLPPYDLLDRIIEEYVEHDKSLEEMIAAGLDEAVVRRVTRMIDRNEYKRRQAPPGIKITSRAFGKDRRFPITNRFEA